MEAGSLSRQKNMDQPNAFGGKNCLNSIEKNKLCCEAKILLKIGEELREKNPIGEKNDSGTVSDRAFKPFHQNPHYSYHQLNNLW